MTPKGPGNDRKASTAFLICVAKSWRTVLNIRKHEVTFPGRQACTASVSFSSYINVLGKNWALTSVVSHWGQTRLNKAHFALIYAIVHVPKKLYLHDQIMYIQTVHWNLTARLDMSISAYMNAGLSCKKKKKNSKEEMHHKNLFPLASLTNPQWLRTEPALNPQVFMWM